MSYLVYDENYDMSKLNYIDRILRKIEEIETNDSQNSKKKIDDCYVHKSFVYLNKPSTSGVKNEKQIFYPKQESEVWSATSSIQNPTRSNVTSFTVEKNLYRQSQNVTYSSSDSRNMVRSKRLTIPEIKLPKESNGKIEISQIEDDVTDDEKDIVKKNDPNSRTWQPAPQPPVIAKPEPIKPPTPKPTLTAKANTPRPPSVIVNSSQPSLKTVTYVKKQKGNSFKRFLNKINPIKKRN